MFEYRVKTYPSGRQQYVRSTSFHDHHDPNHHHHHRHHYRTRCFDNCAGISLEQWNSLCDQNKAVIASNESLTRENQSLKSELQATTQERNQLVADNRLLADEVDSLRRSHSHSHHDGEAAERFRRRIAALKTELDNQDRLVSRLEKENATLSTRVRVLTETVSGYFNWQREAERLQSLLEKTRRALSARNRELNESEAVVEEQRRRLRRLESTLPPRRRFSFV
ncbi:hypothetical protein F5Y13DRAFT_64541 [Hypoxylon sp. FL1857]|nr:hypothetical protein F5Y13DRAFT_64541 [Hypoxylon sp. FL1857]